MNWFRFYHEALDDPKVQRLPPDLFRHWVNVLCLASKQDERGTLPSPTDIAFALRIGDQEAEEVIGRLDAAGLIDRTEAGTLRPHNWSRRQPSSDDVAGRVERYRREKGAAGGNADATLPPTLPVTLHETKKSRPRLRGDTEREEEERDGAVAPSGRPAGDVYALVDAFAIGKGLARGDVVGRSRRDAYNALAAAPAWVTADDVIGCTSYLMTDPFWSQPGKLKAHSVVEALPQWDKQGRPAAAPRPSRNGRNDAGSAELNPADYKDGAYLGRRGAT